MLACLTIASAVALATVGAIPFESMANYTNHLLVSGKLLKSGSFEVAEQLSHRGALELWADLPSKDGSILFSVAPVFHDEVLSTLKDAGVATTILEHDLQKVIDEERGELNYALYTSRPLNLQQFESYDQIVASINYYADAHPLLLKQGPRITPFVTGKTAEDRDIVGIKISNDGTIKKRIVFMECGIHAREWASTSTCLYVIDQLASHQEEHKELLDKFDFHIVPVSNPDGYEYTRSFNRLWRKSRSVQRSSFFPCTGVDLNRNFKAGPHCGAGTQRFPCSEVYCGKAPFSEPETAAMSNYLHQIKDDVEFYVSLHAFGLMWMFPRSYSEEPVADNDELMALAKVGVEAIKQKTGTEYTYGPIATTIYAVTGSAIDWAYEELKIKKSFILEVQPSIEYASGGRGFLLPSSQIIPVGEETLHGLKAMWMS